jgi:hypothetical protein
MESIEDTDLAVGIYNHILVVDLANRNTAERGYNVAEEDVVSLVRESHSELVYFCFFRVVYSHFHQSEVFLSKDH